MYNTIYQKYGRFHTYMAIIRDNGSKQYRPA
jgi:hypothetical protein